MSLKTINVEEEDKELFNKARRAYAFYQMKAISEAEYFHIVMKTHKRGGI